MAYSIENPDGRSMKVVKGPKPFSREITNDKEVYKVGLNAPSQVGIDGKLDSFLEITMQSLRGFNLRETSFGPSADFIRDKRYFKSLQIEKI